jgi:hypothetical protein
MAAEGFGMGNLIIRVTTAGSSEKPAIGAIGKTFPFRDARSEIERLEVFLSSSVQINPVLPAR